MRPASVRGYLEIRSTSPAAWSPDGRRMLVSTNVSGTAQAHRIDLDDGDAPWDAAALPAVTALDDPVAATYLPVALGDDASVLVVADRHGNERTQLYTAGDDPDPAYRDIGELTPLVVDDDHIHRAGGITRDGLRLAYATNRRDGVRFTIHLRELAGPRTGDDLAVFAPEGAAGAAGFSPDGRYLAVSELTRRPGDNRMHLVDLAALGGPDENLAGAGHPSVVELAEHDTSATVGAPSWLPTSDAFWFATDVGREVSIVARGTPDGVWQTEIDTGWPSGCAVDWTGRSLLVAWNEAGVSRARLHDPVSGDGALDVPLPGDGVASGFRFSRDGRRLAFAYSSPLVPGDVWCYELDRGALERLTTSPCPVDTSTFVDAETAVATSFDGLEIPLFVFRPRSASAAAPAPVVVVLHGGPESQYRPSFAPLTQYLVANGFAVVAPNVRGSTGYGRSFQHLDDRERRMDAVADLAAVHEFIARQPELDERRAALYGASYGGYLVLAGLAFQPDRWAAGVDIVGISDLVTFLENTAPWRRAFREREYGSLAQDRDLLRELSPINHVDAIRAPLFLVHGANDPRVPVDEANQIHDALQARGVTSELVVYPDEGHGLARLSNRLDCYPRIARFLERTLT